MSLVLRKVDDLIFISKELGDVPCWHKADPFVEEFWCEKFSEIEININ